MGRATPAYRGRRRAGLAGSALAAGEHLGRCRRAGRRGLRRAGAARPAAPCPARSPACPGAASPAIGRLLLEHPADVLRRHVPLHQVLPDLTGVAGADLGRHAEVVLHHVHLLLVVHHGGEALGLEVIHPLGAAPAGAALEDGDRLGPGRGSAQTRRPPARRSVRPAVWPRNERREIIADSFQCVRRAPTRRSTSGPGSVISSNRCRSSGAATGGPRTRAAGARSGRARRRPAGSPSCPGASLVGEPLDGAGPGPERQIHAEHGRAGREIEQQLAGRQPDLRGERVFDPLQQAGVVHQPGLHPGGNVAGGQVQRPLVAAAARGSARASGSPSRISSSISPSSVASAMACAVELAPRDTAVRTARLNMQVAERTAWCQ